MNKVFLIGNLGKDPETRNLESGTMVANFSLATQEYYKDREGNRQTTTEWHNIVLWAGLAETAGRYLKKGSKVAIIGRIRTRSWDDKDGNKRYTTEIIGSEMEMHGTPRSETQEETQNSQSDDPGIQNEKDDLPF